MPDSKSCKQHQCLLELWVSVRGSLFNSPHRQNLLPYHWLKSHHFRIFTPIFWRSHSEVQSQNRLNIFARATRSYGPHGEGITMHFHRCMLLDLKISKDTSQVVNVCLRSSQYEAPLEIGMAQKFDRKEKMTWIWFSSSFTLHPHSASTLTRAGKSVFHRLAHFNGGTSRFLYSVCQGKVWVRSQG